MTLRLYADESVDQRVVSGVERRGIDVKTAAHDSLLGAPPALRLGHARELERVVLSTDTDFLQFFDANQTQPNPGLIFIVPATPLTDAIRIVALIATALEPADIANWIKWAP